MARSNGGVLVVNPASPVPQLIFAFHTDQTSFVVPPGFMKTGSSYTVSVTALGGPGTTVVKVPFKSGFGARATAISGTIMP